MALKIRLARHGAKKRPYYRIVVADSRSPRDGRFIERVGSYNPMLAKDDENRVKVDVEKCSEWLKKGARPTDRVARFLAQAGIWEYTQGNNPNKGKPGEKAVEREAERAEKAEARKAAEEEAKKEAAEAAKAAEEAAKEAEKAAAEAPAEEAPAEEAASEEPTQNEAEEAKEGDPAAAGEATPAVEG